MPHTRQISLNITGIITMGRPLGGLFYCLMAWFRAQLENGVTSAAESDSASLPLFHPQAPGATWLLMAGGFTGADCQSATTTEVCSEVACDLTVIEIFLICKAENILIYQNKKKSLLYRRKQECLIPC